MPPPRLSIIIPVYNAESTLERSVDSLRAICESHRSEVEVILINDGSTDASQNLIDCITSEQKWGFGYRTVCQENRGAGAARNNGLRHATGKWIQFLDADDELLIDPSDFIAESNDVRCIAFGREIWRNGRKIRERRPVTIQSEKHFFDLMTAENLFQTSQVLFRREECKEFFDEDIACVEDWLFWIRNSSLFSRMAVEQNICTVRLHIHGNNISSQYARAGKNRIEAAKRIAEEMDEKWTRNGREMDEKWTRYQSNNLTLQQAIGQLQQGCFPPFSAFFRWPCQFRLYLKFLVYYCFCVVGRDATPYR